MPVRVIIYEDPTIEELSRFLSWQFIKAHHQQDALNSRFFNQDLAIFAHTHYSSLWWSYVSLSHLMYKNPKNRRVRKLMTYFEDMVYEVFGGGQLPKPDVFNALNTVLDNETQFFMRCFIQDLHSIPSINRFLNLFCDIMNDTKGQYDIRQKDQIFGYVHNTLLDIHEKLNV